MSFVEKRNEIRPDSGEAPFSLDEVFFSRTDKHGIIQAGNYIFRRVAHYEWSEMIGAPHKLIRHPDMPRGVFWLLWDRIQKGEPIGAYVKNKSSDGLHYWVFAVVLPNEGGYLSARIKPTSPMFDMVRSEYASLLQLEKDENLSPADSAALLLDRIQSQGYDNYRDFESMALCSELTQKDATLKHAPNYRLKALRDMLTASEKLRVETQGLTADFHSMRTIPHNLRVIASRLEATGGPITTLSQNYGIMSRDMSDWFEKNVVGEKGNFAAIRTRVQSSLFTEGMLEILKTCDRQLVTERRRLGEVDLDAERAILQKIVADYGQRSADSIETVQREAARIQDACVRLERHVLGLSTTRVMCKIEGARLPRSGESLRDIIGQLKNFQDKVQSRLERISQLSDQIRDGTG
ncbi:MAG: chemotaxis protein [Maritimibacter sp.]